MPPADRNSLRASLVTLRILHGAMCATIGIYLLMLFMVINSQNAAQRNQAPPVEGASTPAPVKQEPPGDIVTIVFAAMAGVSALGLLVVRSKLMPKGADVGRTEALAGSSAALPDQLGAPAKRALARLFTASIFAWALAESVAVFGLILGFLHRDVVHYLPFGACALLLLLVMTPRRAQVEGVVRAAGA